jgi:Dienelactone hydrolase family
LVHFESCQPAVALLSTHKNPRKFRKQSEEAMLRICIPTIATAFAAFAFCAGAAQAEIRTQTFDYKQGDTVLEGFLAWDDAKSEKMPGVLVFPQWTGPTDHERNAARDLAKLGYVAMVADVYGKGIHPPAPKESGIMMEKYLNDRPLLRARVRAGFDRFAGRLSC